MTGTTWHQHLRRASTLALALAAMGASGLAPPPLVPTATCIVGDAQARRAAYVPHALAARDHDARAMAIGLGSAAIGTWDNLGDALAVGGRLWLRNTLRTSPRYYTPTHNRFFRSHYFLYAPAGAKPSAQMHLHAGDLAALASARESRKGALFAGYARFATLATVAIAHAPMRGYAVAAHVPRYYTEPLERHEDVWAFVVGVAAPDAALHARVAVAAGAVSAHALVLRAPPDLHAEPRREDVVSLGRVVLPQSRVTQATLVLYSLRDLRACAEGID